DDEHRQDPQARARVTDGALRFTRVPWCFATPRGTPATGCARTPGEDSVPATWLHPPEPHARWVDWRRPTRTSLGAPVPRVVVDVMLKPEILDPQGKAVHGALPRLGFDGITDVRQGKRFELEVDGDLTQERLDEVRTIAETLLSNPVIEDFAIHPDEPAAQDGAAQDVTAQDGTRCRSASR